MISGIALIAGCCLLLYRKHCLTGTTLVAPWYWVLSSWTTICLCEVVIGACTSQEYSLPVGQLRFLAAITTFCPQMAQMGAKRPQDTSWQWIVLSLWVILAMPVGEHWFSNQFTQLDIGGARSWFLLILIVVGLLNNGPTRFSITAWLLGLSQLILLSEYLPGLQTSFGTTGAMASLALLLTAMVLVILDWPSKRAVNRHEDRAWLDFRDSFGAFWAVRIAQRINDSASRYNWGLWLSWTGFTQVELIGLKEGINSEVNRALRQSMRSLLRRFVSEAWMNDRLPKDPENRDSTIE
ncbi:MAG: hypothetical protein ACKVH8_06730 [Pirellulales bacterium]